jgi:hypothetical protein
MHTTEDMIYHESLSSRKTQALFIALTLFFLLLMVWRVAVREFEFLAGVFLFLSAFFLFYVFNYRTLLIQLTPESLKLKFGIFTWKVPIDNIEECSLDEIPTFKRMGGAGIHFMSIRGRYRTSFNFLEYPRVVITFKRKVGPVRDISFSTQQPDEIIRLVQEVTSTSIQ